MDVASFAELEPEFLARVRRIVWCSVATVDARGRPRSRILHPIWEGSTGWVATRRHSFKGRHLARNPHVSLCYWDPQHEQIYAECRAEWDDDPETKRRIWELFRRTPPPLGWDPGLLWSSPADPEYGLLKLTPWRVELSALGEVMAGKPARVWRHPA